MAEKKQQQLLRRIDMHLLPILFLIYTMAFLDRANIANALTLGMEEDLKLAGQQANIALAVFFVPYVLLEVPSNLILKKMTPKVWLSSCILGFGILVVCQGFVKTYAHLLVTRFFLGVFEAGIFPGSFYLISFWYKREESQTRFTLYSTSAILASAFGSLLASAIAKMDGVAGKSSWRWIFILEGCLTVAVGILSYFTVCDFPEQAKWLTEEERVIVMRKTCRVGSDAGEDEDGPWDRHDILSFIREPQHYLAACMYFCILVPLYAFAYFTPTIVKTLDYSRVQTQLHSVPPYAAAFGMCLVQAYLSDRVNLRYPFVLSCAAMIIVGLAILTTRFGHFSSQYAGLCLVCMGSSTAAPMVICWYLMNLRGHKRRSLGSATMISFGNLGGIVAPFAFLKRNAPHYYAGYAMCLGFASLGLVAMCCYALLVLKARRRARSVATSKEKKDAADVPLL